MDTLKKLPITFIGKAEVRGFEFTQAAESANAYIYQVGHGEDMYYEVFKKKVTAICLDFLTREYSETDFMENYPKKNAFGVTAWTTDSLIKAKKIMKDIEETIKLKADES